MISAIYISHAKKIRTSHTTIRRKIDNARKCDAFVCNFAFPAFATIAQGGAALPTQTDSIRRQIVLIIDNSEDSRQVLRTALERRGVEIFETGHAKRGLELARQHHPTLIVMDLEAVAVDDVSVRDNLDFEAENTQTPVVILGNLCKKRTIRPNCSFVRKPYHYGPLIRKIEQLLSLN